MRISDWSSDVCSSYLQEHRAHLLVDRDAAVLFERGLALAERRGLADALLLVDPHGELAVADRRRADAHRVVDDDGAGARVDDDARGRIGRDEIGMASGRERVCKYG